MRQSAVLFGGIGTLVETSNIQRLAFNDAFEHLGVDFHWDSDTYAKSLATTGGMHRLSALVSPTGATLTQQQIKDAHALKTRYFVSRLANTHLELRPGVSELIESARRQNMKLAWATTTSTANIDALIASTNGALTPAMFAFIGNDKIVTRQKPDPQIYTMCLEALGIHAGQALAIEDGLMGGASAKAAGIRTIAFPGEYHPLEAFHQADLVVSNVASLIELPVA